VPTRKKRRRDRRRPSIAPWILLAGSLAVIGFACTRTPAQHADSGTRKPLAQATAATAAPAQVATSLPGAPALATPAPTQLPARTPAPAVKPTASASAVTPALPEPARSTSAHTQPRLALIIDDCGQWLDTERGFIALPVTLTLSVLPDVRFNHEIEREAADGNKGVMLHLPMETLSGLNPGPGKITTEMDDTAITAQVEHDLGNVDLARGVNNHEGSKATANPRVMNDLRAVLVRHDRFFIDSKTNGASVAEAIAMQHGVATAGRDVFLDNRADVAYTEGQLRAAAALAERTGSAIAIGHPRPTTLAAVRAMIPELQADGIKFVLAADLAH
jgi:polysaccharide deacetylase 2 family uncharacterized protein YibQ